PVALGHVAVRTGRVQEDHHRRLGRVLRGGVEQPVEFHPVGGFERFLDRSGRLGERSRRLPRGESDGESEDERGGHPTSHGGTSCSERGSDKMRNVSGSYAVGARDAREQWAVGGGPWTDRRAEDRNRPRGHFLPTAHFISVLPSPGCGSTAE